MYVLTLDFSESAVNPEVKDSKCKCWMAIQTIHVFFFSLYGCSISHADDFDQKVCLIRMRMDLAKKP